MDVSPADLDISERSDAVVDAPRKPADDAECDHKTETGQKDAPLRAVRHTLLENVAKGSAMKCERSGDKHHRYG